MRANGGGKSWQRKGWCRVKFSRESNFKNKRHVFDKKSSMYTLKFEVGSLDEFKIILF